MAGKDGTGHGVVRRDGNSVTPLTRFNNGPGASFYFTGTPRQVLPARGTRRYLLIVNLSQTTDVYVGIGVLASGPKQGGIPIPPGGSYEMAQFVFSNAIYCAGGDALVIEG